MDALALTKKAQEDVNKIKKHITGFLERESKDGINITFSHETNPAYLSVALASFLCDGWTILFLADPCFGIHESKVICTSLNTFYEMVLDMIIFSGKIASINFVRTLPDKSEVILVPHEFKKTSLMSWSHSDDYCTNIITPTTADIMLYMRGCNYSDLKNLFDAMNPK